MIMCQRIQVMGPSGAGKTTFAARVAERLRLPHTELDAIHWLPDWQMQRREEFRQKVARLVVNDAWVVDGNYGKARDLLWKRVQTVVFLDYPLALCLWRLARRTTGRLLGRQTLWSGNRESIRNAFFGRDALFPYTIRTYARRREQIYAARHDPQFAHIHFEMLRSPGEAENWLTSLPAPAAI